MALKSPSRFRLGAVLVKKHNIISTGFNLMRRTHPISSKYNVKSWSIGIHAELHCTIGLSMNELQGSSMYIYRILKNGQPANSKPCKMCQHFLADVGVKKAHYSLGEGKFGTIKLG